MHQPTEKIRKILEDSDKGHDWLVAAVVHGSIGYYTPLGAENILSNYVRGERENHTERCATCFHYDLEQEILHDISSFETLDLPRQEKLVQIVKEVRKMDGVSQTTFGLFYPTNMF